MSTNRRASEAGTHDRTPDAYRAERAELRARLAAERAELLCSLLGIEVSGLEGRPLIGETTVLTLLSTLSTREESFAEQVEELLGTPHPDAAGHAGPHDRDVGFEGALARCVGARTRFLDAFARVPDEVVFASNGESTGAMSPMSMATQCYWNDSSLSLRALVWSKQEGLGESVGPASLLRASVRAARKELLTTVALVPTAARHMAAFEGGRSLPEILRLVTRLENMFLNALSSAEFPISAPSDGRRGQDDDEWQHAWAGLHATHAALLRVLDSLDPTAFGNELTDGNGNGESIYMWSRGCLLHDRLHAAHIRASLELDWPKRLLR